MCCAFGIFSLGSKGSSESFIYPAHNTGAPHPKQRFGKWFGEAIRQLMISRYISYPNYQVIYHVTDIVNSVTKMLGTPSYASIGSNFYCCLVINR